MVDPIDYSSGLNQSLLTGARLGSLFADSKQQQMANEQAQAQLEQAKQFQTDWQTSFGDPQKMTALAAKYPGQMDAIKLGIGFQDQQQQMALGSAARDLRIAMATGSPQVVQQAAAKHAIALGSVGTSPEELMQQFQQDPQSLAHTVDAVGMSALGAKDYYGVENDRAQRQSERDRLAETARNNDMTNARGWGQIAVSRENSQRSAAGQGQTPASVREYEYFNSLSPEQQKTYMRVRGRPDAGMDGNTVQLSDGRTVSVSGKLHGAGASAFYEGTDTNGNMVRVPASAISAPPTSAASAQNYAMKKDLDVISGASPDDLGFMTGVTGGNGTPALGADVRSRVSGKDQRQLYIATQRIQGRMQNQGVAAARDMGASGINTVEEAKMYFQSMPQIDYSSPDAMKSSVQDIQEYTNNYNQQYQVSVGSGGGRQAAKQPSAQQPAGGSFTSKSGITFTVK